VEYSSVLYDNDSEIIEEYCSSKSDRAATAFVRKYQKFVYATVLRYVVINEDADDIAQEVFIKALNSLEKFRGDSNIKTWLYRIAVNLSLNYIRKKKLLSIFTFHRIGEQEFEFASDSQTPSQELETKEFFHKFTIALAKLPEKQREVFALRYFEDMSYEDISATLGTTVGGLKANYFQAVKKLAVEFKIDKK
jgi:RNA polymerase sigma-70 factor (ECF subfamily)